MFKKYDYRLIHSHRSYTIKEIIRLFKDQGLHDKTIRSWIRSGELVAIIDGNKLLIHGGVLKQFIKNRNKTRQRPLSINEFFCCKCRKITSTLENTIISVAIQTNGSIRAYGLCQNCACVIQRLYKRSQINLILDLFNLEAKALTVLSDSLYSFDNAHPQTDQKPIDLESYAKGSS